jgi:hypothetical protein
MKICSTTLVDAVLLRVAALWVDFMPFNVPMSANVVFDW